MANRIKGITIDIGANTVPLTDALKEADKSLKSTQTQLNDVNRLLKLDPKNVELLSQKHKLLTSAIKDTNDKLKQEREALKQLAENNDGSDKAKQQMEALKREIIATESALKNYKAQLDAMPNALTKFADGLSAAADKTKLLSATAVTALTGMAGMAVKAGAMADDLNTLSKQTGFTTEELQKMQYAADRIDVSVETITGGLQKLTVQVKNGNDAFDTLGVKLTDASGNTRSMTDIFYDTVEALSHIENETDRDTMAMELFGKSASSLAGIVDDGGAALRQLGEEAENAGLILSQDAVDAANAFNDKVDELKAKAQAAFFESGAAIAESFIPAMEKLVEVGTNVLQFVANMDTGTIQLVTTILALTAALTPVLKALSVGIGLINNVGTLINGLTTTVIPAVSSAMAAGSAGMIASLSAILPVIAAIAAALAGVIVLIDAIRHKKINDAWDKYTTTQTAGMTSISAEQAKNWMNKGEVQTIIDPAGNKQYYVNNSNYDWQKANAAANGWTDDAVWGDNAVNMTVNVDHINDLQDLLDISQQAQLTTRMGG
jgi:phage-related minor tail protein